MQDRVQRIEKCINDQAKVTSDPTVKNFGMQIKGQMMEVSIACFVFSDSIHCRQHAPMHPPFCSPAQHVQRCTDSAFLKATSVCALKHTILAIIVSPDSHILFSTLAWQ